jgi:hypothetical protein
MSNFLSQYAAARAGGKATGGLAGLQIRRTGLGEMRTIEDEIRTMEEKLAEEQESARKREGRRGRGRLAGAIGGGLLAAALAPFTGGGSLAIAAGAGLGSYAGQELGARGFGTAAGIGSRKRYLDKIRSGLDANEGMFFKGKRKDVDLKRSKINQFLRDADRQFNDSILAGAVTDAMTGFQVSKFAQGGGFKDIFGKESAPGLLDFSKAAKVGKDQASLAYSQAINKFIDPSAYAFGGSRDNPYMNFLKKISPDSPFIDILGNN